MTLISRVFVNQDSVLVVDIQHGEHLFYLLDVEQRTNAMRFAEHIRDTFPEAAQQILTILVNSAEAVA